MSESPPSVPLPVPRFSMSPLGSFGMFLVLFAGYLLSTSRERPWADATPVFQVAESIVNRGEFDITTAWPPTSPRGSDGKVYALAPILQSAVHVPGAWLRKQALEIWPQHDAFLLPWAAHLAPAALGALTCMLFLGLCRREGFSLGVTLSLTLTLAVGTSLWVYARQPYSEILQTFALLGFFCAFIAMGRQASVRNTIALAVWAGLLINAKPVFAPLFPGVALYVAWLLRRDWRRLLLLATIATITVIPFLGVIIAYNQVRWSDAATTGYGIGSAAFAENPLFGFWGLFLSPGKSVLLYSPPLFLSLFGLRQLWRRQRPIALCLIFTVIPPIYVYARFTFWSGDWAWGPRYLVPFIPLFLFPAAYTLEALSAITARAWRWTARTATAAVLAAGLCVQLIGISLYWDHFIRISFDAGMRWLGNPNLVGSISFIENNCGACFEQMHYAHWLPPYQPIKGQYWLLKHVWNNDPWTVAALDGPWWDYTDVTADASVTYARARLDWWYRDYHEGYRDLGVFLVEYLALATTLGGAAWAFDLYRQNRRTLPVRQGVESGAAPPEREAPVAGEPAGREHLDTT